MARRDREWLTVELWISSFTFRMVVLLIYFTNAATETRSDASSLFFNSKNEDLNAEAYF